MISEEDMMQESALFPWLDEHIPDDETDGDGWYDEGWYDEDDWYDDVDGDLDDEDDI